MKNIIEDYKNLKTNMNLLIQKSGYKNAFLAEKIGMSPVKFSMKKKKGNWTDDELEKLLDIIEDEELEDYFLGKVMELRKNDERMSYEEFKQAISESRTN